MWTFLGVFLTSLSSFIYSPLPPPLSSLLTPVLPKTHTTSKQPLQASKMRSNSDNLSQSKRRMINMEDQRCYICNQPRDVQTSWTSVNPSRRFVACPNKHCKDFVWMDPPMCERSIQIIPGLLKKRTRMEEEIAMLKKKGKMLWFSLGISGVLFALFWSWNV